MKENPRAARKTKSLFPILLLIIGLATAMSGDAWGVVREPDIRLSRQERNWLAEHPVILAAPDPDFPPVEYYDEKGLYKGIAADYIAFIEKRLGIRFKIVRLKNWDEVLEKARAREIDMVTHWCQSLNCELNTEIYKDTITHFQIIQGDYILRKDE